MSLEDRGREARPSRTSARREREPFADVGRAMREAIERALEDSVTARQARVLLAVIHLTASYSRVTDRVYVAQIASVARIAGDTNERHTRRALAELHERGVIVWAPAKGRGRTSWVSLTPELIDAFREDLERAGVGPAAVRKTLAVLSSILGRAVLWGRIPTNPAAAVRKPVQRRVRTVVR